MLRLAAYIWSAIADPIPIANMGFRLQIEQRRKATLRSRSLPRSNQGRVAPLETAGVLSTPAATAVTAYT